MYRLTFLSADGGTTTFEEQKILRIGRSVENDIVLDAPGVAEKHAELRPTLDGWDLYDTGTNAGTWIGGRRVDQEPLGPTTAVRFGAEGDGAEARITIDLPGEGVRPGPAFAGAVSPDPNRTILPTDLDSTIDDRADALLIRTRDGDKRVSGNKTVRIGRDAQSEVVIDDPVVSRQHAEVQKRADGWWYVDHSNSGSFIDDERVEEKQIDEETMVQLGHPAAGYQVTLIPISDVKSAQKAIAGKRWRNRSVIVAAAMAVVVLVAGGVAASLALKKDRPEPNTLTAAELDRAKNASVQIIMLDKRGNPLGSGSGSIITSDGLILTNAHVAKPSAKGMDANPSDDPAEFSIAFAKDDYTPAAPKYRAKTVVADGYLDLAVVKITANADGTPLAGGKAELPEPMPIGDSNALHTGDRITTLGYPGLTMDDRETGPLTITSGDVSAFKRDYATNTDRFWIDMTARIAHGNSGGASVNKDGELVGVNTRFQMGQGGEPGASFLTRPSALAADLIRVAKNGGDPDYVSPFLSKIQSLPATAKATSSGWSTTRTGCGPAVDQEKVTHLSGVSEGDTVYPNFNLTGIPNDVPFVFRLVNLDNEKIIDGIEGVWSFGPSERCIHPPVEYTAGLKRVIAVFAAGYQRELLVGNPVEFD